MSNHNWANRLWETLGERHSKAHSDASQLQSLTPRSAARTISGGRSENQDSFFSDDHVAVYIVADGIAGHRGGGLASSMVVDSLARKLANLSSQDELPLESMQAPLRQALLAVSHELAKIAKLHPELDGMGCALAFGFIQGNALFFSHLGDSRIYLHRKGKLTRLTEDESLAQEMYAARMLTSKELRRHSWRHILTNSLTSQGMQHIPRLERLSLEPNDRLLFTTDGLVEKLGEPRLAHSLSAGTTCMACAEELTNEAAHAESEHNVTSIVIFIESARRASPEIPQGKPHE